MTDRRRSSFVVPLVLIGGGVLLALLGAHLAPSGYTSAAPATRTVQAGPTSTRSVVPSGPEAGSDNSSRARHQIGGLLIGLYVALVGTLIGFLAVAIARSLGAWRPARRGARRRAPPARAPDPSPNVRIAAQLAAAASAGLDDLAAEGPAADVIIACWQRMRAAADQSGAEPVASDTPDEVVVRVAGALSEQLASPLGRLAELYREARFSQHLLSRGDVWVARKELQTVLTMLAPDATVGRAAARASPTEVAVERDVR